MLLQEFNHRARKYALLGSLYGTGVYTVLDSPIPLRALFTAAASLMLVRLIRQKPLFPDFKWGNTAEQPDVNHSPASSVPDHIKEIVSELSKKAGIEAPQISMLSAASDDGGQIAYVIANKIFIGKSFINLAMDDEMARSVLAHEIVHIKNKDSNLSIFNMGLSVAILCNWVGVSFLDPWMGVPVLSSLIPAAVASFAAIRREIEYLTDIEGAKLLGTARPLIKHLMLSNLGGREHVWEYVTALHPKNEDRIDNLLKVEKHMNPNQDMSFFSIVCK